MKLDRVALMFFLGASPALAQSSSTVEATTPFTAAANPMMHVAVSSLHPGAVPPERTAENPLANDPQAVTRGMRDFILFNCVGCHAPNGGGGMGPALSEGRYTYGGNPADLFLSIFQGRPNGMPTWGETLPESTIWELVAYVQSIGQKPGKTLGRTISRTPLSPNIQQVPAEYLQTTHPWSFTEAFSNGQKPNGE
jgi:cytochrome c oxidase cbb3-type subunit 3